MLEDQLGKDNYPSMLVAAITARAIVGFLGLRHHDGKVCPATDYYPNDGKTSYEVKASDLDGGKLLNENDLTPSERSAVASGIRETDVAFAHLTFWSSGSDQSADGAATPRYTHEQFERIQLFAVTALKLLRSASKSWKHGAL
jgi:hypothetical protein